MSENFLHHKNFKRSIFKPFLLYRNIEAGKPYNPLSKSEKLQKGTEEIEKAKEAIKLHIEKQIKQYNENYSSSRFDKWSVRKRYKNANQESINDNLDHPEKTIAEIDRILATPFLHGSFRKKQWRSLIDANVPQEYKAQKKKLLNLRASLTDSKKIEGGNKIGIIPIDKYFLEEWNKLSLNSSIDRDTAPDDNLDIQLKIIAFKSIRNKMNAVIKQLDSKKDDRYYQLLEKRAKVELQINLLENKEPARPSYAAILNQREEELDKLARSYGNYFTESHDRLIAMGEKKTEWEKRKGYDKIKTAFDAATTMPIISAGSDEFKEFWDLPAHGISTQKQRESRQLFLAIAAKDTANFTTDFILGSESRFGKDYQKNRINYPYIYHEWLKEKGVDVEGLRAQDKRVAMLESELVAEGISSVEEIITNNATAGIDLKELKKIEQKYSSHKNREYWEEKEHEINNIVWKLKRAAGKAAKKGDNGEVWIKAANQLEKHKHLAKEQKIKWHYLRNEKENIDIDFTRYSMDKPQNRQILTELSMRKFKKAMQIVDQSSEGQADWRDFYHPTVRQLLIATIYDSGVSRLSKSNETGEWEYTEDINHEHYWLLTQLSKSQYFNSEEVGDYMDDTHRKLLWVGMMANKVFVDLEYTNVALETLNKTKELKEQNPDPNSDSFKKGHATLIAKYPSVMVKNAMQADVNQLDKRIKLIIETIIPNKQEFIRRAEQAIQNPYDKEKNMTSDTVAFLKDIENNNKYANVIKKDEMDEYNKKIKAIEFGYNTLDHNEKSRMDYLNELGINVKGTYQAYLLFLKENPDMHVSNWNDLRTSSDKGKFTKLYNCLSQVMQANKAEGKEHFLRVFKTLHDNNLAKEPENNKEQLMALSVFNILQIEIMEKEKAYAYSDKEGKEIESKMRGMHLGDKISKYASRLWRMAFGPGQSIAERGAAVAAFLIGFKTLSKAIKGNDKFSWILKILGGGVALDVITGGKLMDMLGVSSVKGAMEGTFEAVLADHGKKNDIMKKKDIDEREHISALYEMNKVPFHKLMQWYKKTDKNGMPREGEADIFPKGISISKITKGITWKEKNKPLEARRIAKAAMDNFFEYVGTQEGVTAVEAGKRLDERWVKMRKNKNFQPEHSSLIYHGIFDGDNGRYRKSPNLLTWQIVMRSEIDVADLEATKRKSGLTPLVDTIIEAGGKFVRWTRQDIYGKMQGHIETFAKNNGLKIDMLQEFIGDMADKGGEYIHFTKESLKVSYDNHQWEIKRFLGDHWELIKTGAKLPFEILYGSLKIATPWTLAKLNQIREVFRSNKMVKIPGDLKEEYIAGMVGNKSILETPHLFNIEKNPEFSYFGIYQRAFAEAFNSKEKYYKTPELDWKEKPSRLLFPDSQVGYYISETDQEKAEISPFADTDIPDKYNMMGSKSWEQARDFYMGKDRNLSVEDIEKYMYPIHMYTTMSKEGKSPEKIYVFWRMPLSDSNEYHLKKMGRWADYKDPNDYKTRLPFMVDPSKDILDNLKNALTINTGTTRNIVGVLGAAAIQPVHFLMGLGERGADVINGIYNIKNRKTGRKEKVEWAEVLLKPVTEESQQTIDEIATTAENGKPWAMSAFYKNERNARIYRSLLDYAKAEQQPLYLGLFEDQPTISGYKSNFYSKSKGSFSYEGFENYYNSIWAPHNGEIDGMDTMIKAKKTKKKKK